MLIESEPFRAQLTSLRNNATGAEYTAHQATIDLLDSQPEACCKNCANTSPTDTHYRCKLDDYVARGCFVCKFFASKEAADEQ